MNEHKYRIPYSNYKQDSSVLELKASIKWQAHWEHMVITVPSLQTVTV